jgi:phage recombination protein Bet
MNEQQQEKRQGIVVWAAQEYGVEAGKVIAILRATAFAQKAGDDPATDAEVAALLNVAREYKLNPFLRQLYAFKARGGGGIVPIVGVDGWARIVADHPQCDGFEFRESEQVTKHDGKEVPVWIECKMFRKDRQHPVVVRERFDECVRPGNAWSQTPSRMLRHRAFMQAGRLTLGLTGIFDESELPPEIDVGGSSAVPTTGPAPASKTDGLATELAKRAKPKPKAEDVSEVDPDTGEVLGAEPERGFPPTDAELEAALAAITDAASGQLALDMIHRLPTGSKRDAFLLRWNERCAVPEPAPAQPDPAPEPKEKKSKAKKPVADTAIKDKVIADMVATDSVEKLDDVAEKANLAYAWPRELLGPLNAAYVAHLTKLEQTQGKFGSE